MRSVTIRLAVPGDRAALERLAALDSARLPGGELLVGVVDDEPWAALALDGGAVVADPFRRSAEVLALLHERARLLGYPPSRSARMRRWRRRTVICGPFESASSSHWRLSPRSTRM
jgi:hypothetical protein